MKIKINLLFKSGAKVTNIQDLRTKDEIQAFEGALLTLDKSFKIEEVRGVVTFGNEEKRTSLNVRITDVSAYEIIVMEG